MSLSTSMSDTLRQLEKINLVEAKGHLDHPEDLVFLDDIAGANNAIKAIEQTIAQPGTITIKWDGYPALIFGTNQDGRFSIMDKHMFNKKDGTGRQVFSAKEFRVYDKNRGVDRGDLYQIIDSIWDGLEKADRGSVGYYWGDLLFARPLQDQDGYYSFKMNPNGIAYKVKADSEVGHMLSGKTAGIGVHTFIPANAVTTDESSSLDGTIGNLHNNSDVAIVPSKMPLTPKIKMPGKLKAEAEAEIAKYGNDVRLLMQSAPQARNAFNSLFTVFINKKIVSKNLSNLYSDFIQFIDQRSMTDSMRTKITNHFNAHKEGVIGAFKIWIALYNLKQNVVDQLDKAAQSSPVKGYLDDGTETHEGFVANGLKFVNRMGFSAQNLAAK
jgi:hypothetical protein